MLHKEPKHTYIVYPSWAELTYRWEGLSGLLADPFGSECIRDLGYTPEDYRRFGWPDEIQPFELIDGPEGGGVILVHIGGGERWTPLLVLTSEAHVGPPGAMETLRGCDINVHLIEPKGDEGWEYGLGKRPRSYSIGASIEHVEEAGDSIFWLIGYERAKSNKEIRGLCDISRWGEHFGLRVDQLSQPSEAIQKAVECWLNPEYQYVWFSIEGGGSGAGYHFAIAVYVGYHLCSVAGRRMSAIHLISQIEGQLAVFSRKRHPLR